LIDEDGSRERFPDTDPNEAYEARKAD